MLIHNQKKIEVVVIGTVVFIITIISIPIITYPVQSKYRNGRGWNGLIDR